MGRYRERTSPTNHVSICSDCICGPLGHSLQVVDYVKAVQPRFDKALESLVRNTIAEATEAAITAVKEQLLTQLQAKRQGEPSFQCVSDIGRPLSLLPVGSGLDDPAACPPEPLTNAWLNK